MQNLSAFQGNALNNLEVISGGAMSGYWTGSVCKGCSADCEGTPDDTEVYTWDPCDSTTSSTDSLSTGGD